MNKNYKIYTGIGSRNVPEHIAESMKEVAYRLASKGYILRSGKAGGSDEAFQLGVQKYISYKVTEDIRLDIASIVEIYIPWKGFDNNCLWDDWDIVPSKMNECMKIASEIHPAWDKCSFGAKKLHARNICQLFGDSLDIPSDFVLFYAKESKNGNVSGGTATAVNLARKHNIPTINMYFDDWEDKLNKLLGDK